MILCWFYVKLEIQVEFQVVYPEQMFHDSGAIILVVSEIWSSMVQVGACCSLGIKSLHESVVIGKFSELGHD